jgi:hypothetical protein
MKPAFFLAAALLWGGTVPALAQEATAPALGEVVVTANRMNGRYAQNERPVVGLRRPADSVVLPVAFSSDSRDFATRKREIFAMLLSALERAPGAGVELVTGSLELVPVTKADYQELPLAPAGRVDTSQTVIMVKAKLAGSTAAAQKQIDAFLKGVSRTGRAAIDPAGSLTLTIVNPDQYRDTIVKLVADNARRYAAVFGPDYAVQVGGIDSQISWSQVSGTDVFLYVPYRFTIVPK